MMDIPRNGLTTWLVFFILSQTRIFPLTIVQLAILLAISVYIPWTIKALHNQKVRQDLFIISSISIFVAFQRHQGLVTAGFVLPWIGVGSYYAIQLMRKNLDKEISSALQFSSATFIIAAAFTLFLSRAGIQAFGFSHTIIELTAIHFHYSGILIPIFVFHLNLNYPGLIPKVILWITVFGTVIVAIGITIGSMFPIFGILSVLLFAGSLLIISILTLVKIEDIFIKTAHLFLIITMILAIYYAIGVGTTLTTISIPLMILSHGIINGVLFVPLSIYGWSMLGLNRD